MKTREGFVSNSSSTSFVIVMNIDGDQCPVCKRRDPNFLDMIDAYGNNDFETTRVKHRGVEDISMGNADFQNDWYGDEHKQTWINTLELAKQAEDKGMKVAEIEISYHDGNTTDIFQSLVDQNKIIVIWDDHRGNNHVEARKAIEAL